MPTGLDRLFIWQINDLRKFDVERAIEIELSSRLADTGQNWSASDSAGTRNSPERKTANPLGLAVSLYLLVVMGGICGYGKNRNKINIVLQLYFEMSHSVNSPMSHDTATYLLFQSSLAFVRPACH